MYSAEKKETAGGGMMVLEIILGVVIITLAVVAGVVYWMWKKTDSPAEDYKTIEQGQSRVHIRAHHDLKEVVVRDRAEKEKLTFVRSDVKKGEAVEFIYPVSMKNAHIVFRMNGDEQVVHAGPG